jgi:hypothetical protein
MAEMTLKTKVLTWKQLHCESTLEMVRLDNLLSEIFDEIERRAEGNMLKTSKLEGSHYAAMKEVRTELGIPRKP